MAAKRSGDPEAIGRRSGLYGRAVGALWAREGYPVAVQFVLVAALTLSVIGLLNPLIFWALAGISAVFAFKILPKIGQ